MPELDIIMDFGNYLVDLFNISEGHAKVLYYALRNYWSNVTAINLIWKIYSFPIGFLANYMQMHDIYNYKYIPWYLEWLSIPCYGMSSYHFYWLPMFYIFGPIVFQFWFRPYNLCKKLYSIKLKIEVMINPKKEFEKIEKEYNQLEELNIRLRREFYSFNNDLVLHPVYMGIAINNQEEIPGETTEECLDYLTKSYITDLII